MAHLYCRRRTRVWTQIQIPNLMATLYHAEHVHIARTQTWIPTPYFCIGQESVPESVPGNVNEPLLKGSYIRETIWVPFGAQLSC